MKRAIFSIFLWGFLTTFAFTQQTMDTVVIKLEPGPKSTLILPKSKVDYSQNDVLIMLDASLVKCENPKLFIRKKNGEKQSLNPLDSTKPNEFITQKGEEFSAFIAVCGTTEYPEIKVENTSTVSPSKSRPASRATDTTNKGDSIRLEFLGNGDIQKSFREGAPLQANTGLGVSFQRLWFGTYKKNKSDLTGKMKSSNYKNYSTDSIIVDYHKIQDLSLDFVINVASTADSTFTKFNADKTLQNARDFGTYLLIPANSRQAAFLDFNMYFSNNWEKLWASKLFSIVNGVNVRFVGSNNTWVNTADSSKATVNATGLLARVGFFYDFIPDNVRRNNDYSVTIGLNYTFRGLFGDISSDETKYKNMRLAILGTEQKRWNGFEINLGIRFKNIRAEVQIPTLYRKQGNGVPGLTNTQFVTSIRFIGGFPLGIKK